MTVDVNGSVYVEEFDDIMFPIQFGKVSGTFTIGMCEQLKTLKGCPNHVGGVFAVDSCDKLTSLEGSPATVGGHCILNLEKLRSLKKSNFVSIGDHLDISDCKMKSISDFDYPMSIGGDLVTQVATEISRMKISGVVRNYNRDLDEYM